MKSILIQQAYEGLGFEDMLNLTKDRHTEYCKTHGIEYMPVFGNVIDYDPLLGAYAKIALIQKAMNDGYDAVIWLDADTLIADMETSVVDAVELGKIGSCWHRIPQLNHWNVGVLYVHNCEETRKFIDEWLSVYPPPKDGWNEQGVFNRMARKSKTVVTISDKWNATLDVSMVPDAVVLGFHGQGDAKHRTELMKVTLDTIAAKKAQSDSGNRVRSNG